MPYVLPGPFVDHVATLTDPEHADLAALCHAAPLAYWRGDDRRVFADVWQAARLHTLADALITFPGDPLDGAARRTVRDLAPAADWAAQHPHTTT